MEQQQRGAPEAPAPRGSNGGGANPPPAPRARRAGGARRGNRRGGAGAAAANAAPAPPRAAPVGGRTNANANAAGGGSGGTQQRPRQQQPPLREAVEAAFAEMRAAANDPARLLAVRTNTIRMLDDRLAQIEEEEEAIMQRHTALRATYLKSRVEMQLRMASVLAEAINYAESPAGCWREIQSLTRTRDETEAKAVASQLIGFAVAWRCCQSQRPSIFDELCENDFAVEDLCVTARAGILLVLETVDEATGEMTPQDDRITVVPGFCFSQAVDEAIERSAPRRAEEERQKIALFMAVHNTMQERRRNGTAPVDPNDLDVPPLDLSEVGDWRAQLRLRAPVAGAAAEGFDLGGGAGGDGPSTSGRA